MGAAVALSANGTRFFHQFGLTEQLAPHWFEVAALIFRNGRNGHVVGKQTVGAEYRHRFGAPYVGIHRADLQTTMRCIPGAAGFAASCR